MVTQFTPIASTIGGVLIGIAAVMLMLFTGRIAGISGIAARLFPPYYDSDAIGATAFVTGLMLAPVAYMLTTGNAVMQTVSGDVVLMAAAGFLVGLGAAFGGGCTSGHGVCGLSRLSLRSIVATAIFVAAAIATVFITRHLLGAG